MSSSLENPLSDAFLEAKNSGIELKKSEDVFEGLSLGIPWFPVTNTSIQNVCSHLNRRVTVMACKWLVGKEL